VFHPLYREDDTEAAVALRLTAATLEDVPGVVHPRRYPGGRGAPVPAA
jgi:hypothetical protein